MTSRMSSYLRNQRSHMLKIFMKGEKRFKIQLHQIPGLSWTIRRSKKKAAWGWHLPHVRARVNPASLGTCYVPSVFQNNSWTAADIDIERGIPLRTSIVRPLISKIYIGANIFSDIASFVTTSHATLVERFSLLKAPFISRLQVNARGDPDWPKPVILYMYWCVLS